jgi:hypothetical protein
MIGKYHHAMPTFLKSNSSIYDKTLCTTDAKIRVKEDDRAFIFGVSSHDCALSFFRGYLREEGLVGVRL